MDSLYWPIEPPTLTASQAITADKTRRVPYWCHCSRRPSSSQDTKRYYCKVLCAVAQAWCGWIASRVTTCRKNGPHAPERRDPFIPHCGVLLEVQYCTRGSQPGRGATSGYRDRLLEPVCKLPIQSPSALEIDAYVHCLQYCMPHTLELGIVIISLDWKSLHATNVVVVAIRSVHPSRSTCYYFRH